MYCCFAVGVTDPTSGEEISLREAIDRGIVDQSRGTYNNPRTGVSVPIPVAVNQGRIKVEVVQTLETEERRQDLGLITIRTTNETRPFHVERVIDAKSDKEYSLEKAVKKGLLDQENGLYKNTDTGDMMSISDAVDSGLVIVSFDEGDDVTKEPEVVSKTYAVRAVVDPETRERVPFSVAVDTGLLDPETGAYTNKATGETLYASDAIQKGLIKATVVADPKSGSQAAEKHARLMAKLHAAKGKIVANAATTSYLEQTRMRMQRLREAKRKTGKKFLYYWWFQCILLLCVIIDI